MLNIPEQINIAKQSINLFYFYPDSTELQHSAFAFVKALLMDWIEKKIKIRPMLVNLCVEYSFISM